MSKLNSTSPSQVMQNVYDEPNQALRTTATVNFDGEINVEINAADGDNVAISDGTNTLAVNPDGSINTVTSFPAVVNVYDEVNSVPSSTLTTILTHNVINNGRLKNVVVSGTNIAEYQVIINSVLVDKKRTYFGASLNLDFNFDVGVYVNSTDIIYIKVQHSRPSVGDFNARLQLVEV